MSLFNEHLKKLRNLENSIDDLLEDRSELIKKYSEAMYKFKINSSDKGFMVLERKLRSNNKKMYELTLLFNKLYVLRAYKDRVKEINKIKNRILLGRFF